MYFVLIILLLYIILSPNKCIKSRENISINDFIHYSFMYLKYMNNIKCKKLFKNITCLKINEYNKYDNIHVVFSKPIQTKKIIYRKTYFYPNMRLYQVNYNKSIFFSKRIYSFAFKNVILSFMGTIHTKCWSISTTGGCKCNILPHIEINNKQYKSYDKVITITHQYGNAVYHSIIECLAKMGYFIPEIINDKSIKIHIMCSASKMYLKLLGFDDERIVSGNIYVKKLLVLEKGKDCGYPPPSLHLFSLRYYLRLKIKSKPIYDIVIIKRLSTNYRKGRREIINFEEVYKTLCQNFLSYKVVIFYPNTTFNETINYFRHAKLIVAPHGAGLSNIIISNSDCKIIEFYTNNFCYFTLATTLGLNYYGMYEKLINGKYNVSIENFKYILKSIINHF